MVGIRGVREAQLQQPLSAESARQLLNSVEAFLFDCDGVIWKGDKLIDGVPSALQSLRSMGKKVVFVTNNSTKSRKQYVEKFRVLGLEVSEDEIFSSSFGTAMFLKQNNFPPEKKEDGKKSVKLKSNYIFEHDKSVGAVVVGDDHYINYYKLQYATLCIRENLKCLFIATNRDSVAHLTDIQEWPGAGCMVAAVCGSTQREPTVVGKPSSFMMDFLLDKFQLDISKICMVGDRLDTDVLFGLTAGCKTLLVLSGVTTLSALQDPANNIHPDYFTNTISNIISLART